MAGTGRQIFSPAEKVCLQKLIFKYKLNATSAMRTRNPAIKKAAWARLVQEFNSIETNSKRNELQLKKLWDNLKTRRKAQLAAEKKESIRIAEGFPMPGISKEFLENKLLAETIELQDVVDVDVKPPKSYLSGASVNIEIEPWEENIPSDDVNIERVFNNRKSSTNDSGSRSVSDHNKHDYSEQPSESTQPQGTKSIPSRLISDNIRTQQDELYKLQIAEKQWNVKAAEEMYNKAQLERQSAEELLRCNQAKREEAEICLRMRKRNFEKFE